LTYRHCVVQNKRVVFVTTKAFVLKPTLVWFINCTKTANADEHACMHECTTRLVIGESIAGMLYCTINYLLTLPYTFQAIVVTYTHTNTEIAFWACALVVGGKCSRLENNNK
jgi:hypothetical protein